MGAGIQKDTRVVRVLRPGPYLGRARERGYQFKDDELDRISGPALGALESEGFIEVQSADRVPANAAARLTALEKAAERTQGLAGELAKIHVAVEHLNTYGAQARALASRCSELEASNEGLRSLVQSLKARVDTLQTASVSKGGGSKK